MGIFEFIQKEGVVLKGAPFSFIGLLVVGLSGGFTGGMMFRGQEVADANALIRLKDGQIDGYQKTLSDRLDKVERQLSSQQLSSIKSNIKTDPSSVEVIGGHPDKPDPRVDQLKNVFKESGWSVGTAQSQSTTADLLVRAPDLKTSTTIENALKDAGVAYQTAKPSTTGGTDFFLVPAK